MSSNFATIDAAIRRLESDSSEDRKHAREALEAVGRPATGQLVRFLKPAGPGARHEALRVLAAIGDPEALDTFVEHLDDEESDCRWAAGEGLGKLGETGLRRVLEILLDPPGEEHQLRAVHHALDELSKAGFDSVARPVLLAFQSPRREVELPTTAHTALERLRHEAASEAARAASGKG
ncbi:HEAT repeat domain-containing protein [Engelhardtia mirabilis]|uniref:PBS lyase HEAT-like repeat protein n=1 Tax=Engelhardtia mirabilis TaxID=2528011 RepID=A0A518BH89_9BACT|nr:PBS lyase HEAT-like repeat protein [Planctomycetes bacterium Pla133]QDV00675.1 PBS lyase HEAT-like repeat protein [Planctomycetes bacterium Pla86]